MPGNAKRGMAGRAARRALAAAALMVGGVAVAGVTIGGMTAAPALAHHGWGSYETAAQTVEGKVAKVAWGSPHVTIWMDRGGTMTEIVLAPISRMEARGLKQDMLTEGATVSLDAYPHKEGKAEMRAERIRVAGQSVELR